MSDREKLGKLRHLSRLILDISLMRLDRASLARQRSIDGLAKLNCPDAPTDLNPVVAGEVALRYQLWADQRRSAINLVLARQTADWDDARQDAVRALGRASVVKKLCDPGTSQD